MLINEAIDLLRTHNGESELTLHKGADESLLLMVEHTYNITLPDDFKLFYRFSNGFETVEDIFNMIPLEEIISNKEQHNENPLYIAEYMIYSDMWELEINPDDCNDYTIIVRSHYNKLVITHSLAEFIERFLNGGVFDPGGLYDWQEEVELQPIYTTKLKTAESLLTVFYYALRYGIISKKEVVDWVDRLVMHENEPESFFIDLSLGHDKNELISLLQSKCIPDDHTITRAMLGLLYHRLLDGVINIDEAILILDKHSFFDLLTRSETAQIYDITDEIRMGDITIDDNELTQKVLGFLAYYKEFNITNYKYWSGLSYHIKYRFSEEEKKLNAEYIAPSNKMEIKLWVMRTIAYALALIALIILITTYAKVENDIPSGKFRNDLYQLSKLYFFFFICYYVLKAGEWLIEKLVAGLKKIFN